jgi:septation ring formation regulator EzrA
MFIKHSMDDISKVNDDLAEVWLTYIPLANPKDYADRRQLKKELADIEDRLIDKTLPFANKEYRFSRNQNRLQYSKTKLPANYTPPTLDQPPTRPIRTVQPKLASIPRTNSIAVINQAKELKSKLQSLPNQNRTIQSTIDNLDTIINNKKISRSQDQVAPVIVTRVQDLINRYQ